jgi:threonine/homoserine/homoserine lactone efflux protein
VRGKPLAHGNSLNDVLTMVLTFIPVAALLSLTPGAATVLVVHSAARRGRRAALMTTVGNSVGVAVWAAATAVGLAAVVAASAVAFTVVKLCGAVTLLYIGIRTILHAGAEPTEDPGPRRARSAFRAGLMTSIANPKLAVFFLALFPQFVPDGAPVLPAALLMAAVIVTFDLVWYSTLAALVARATDAFLRGGWLRRAQRLCGGVLVGLGLRLALEER